jgi:hypothetical protein
LTLALDVEHFGPDEQVPFLVQYIDRRYQLHGLGELLAGAGAGQSVEHLIKEAVHFALFEQRRTTTTLWI